jgi:hypothetical protein
MEQSPLLFSDAHIDVYASGVTRTKAQHPECPAGCVPLATVRRLAETYASLARESAGQHLPAWEASRVR